jgi:hypothetical protein
MNPFGNQKPEGTDMSPDFPDDCIQRMALSWWEKAQPERNR